MPNLFMVDLEGLEVSEFERTILGHPNVGSLILFSRNFKNPEQLKKLIEDIRAIRSDIFIAVDHEGGYVQRFQRHGIRSLPSARVYGDVYDLNPETGIKLARKYGAIMASDLLALGIDLSLAPIVDLHGESDVIAKLDRAFHSSPNVVAELAEAFIDGMNAEGMPSVSKHFPGHGADIDSHIKKPVSDIPEEKLRKTDLKPFMELIKKQKLSAIMPAHIIYKNIDADNPAGFSKIWLQDILREELGFQGIILSDCLGMNGADIGDMKTRAECALKAGCDMLIMCNQSRELLYEVLKTVNFESNKDSEKRLEVFKKQMLRFKNPDKDKKYLDPILPSTLMGGSIFNTEQKKESIMETTADTINFDNINTTKTI